MAVTRRALSRLALPLGLAAGVYALALGLTAPAWPDDWEGIGFVESVRDFDLSRYRPHAPGYPAYVALLRVSGLFFRDGVAACIAVSVLSGAAAMLLLWHAMRQLAGRWTAWVVMSLVAALPIVWRACSGVGSEATALACGAGCAWALTLRRSARSRAAGPTAEAKSRTAWLGSVVLGVSAGLGLGVRLSWAPLYLAALALAPRAGRLRTWSVAAIACLAWGVPLLAIVGPSKLLTLGEEHLAGHALRWGGTAITEPGVSRLWWSLRDVFVDGMGAGVDALGIMIALLVAAGLLAALRAWGAAGLPGARGALLLFVPYAVWIFVGQNVRDQPRHALPLVVLLAIAMGLRAARSPRVLGIICALVLLVAVRTMHEALSRQHVPPPGEQLVTLARAQPFPERLAVFGVRSTRFFELTELAPIACSAGALGNVQLALAGYKVLPSRVWVTSEVDRTGGSQWPLARVATLCGPRRPGSEANCIDVDEWNLPYLP